MPQRYHRARWHRLKLSLVSGLRVLQDEMDRAHRNTLTQLLHSANTTRTALTTGAGTADPWLVATKAIAHHHAHTARQATTASTVLDQLYGDKATVYFHNLAKSPPPPTVIRSILALMARTPPLSASLLMQARQQQLLLL